MERVKCQPNRKKTIITILVFTIGTAAVIAGFLIYKGNFNKLVYSNWLFYSSMAYIAIGGLASLGSYMSVNNFSHKYASTVMTANYEERKKVDNLYMNISNRFNIQMITIGLLLILLSVVANNVL
ncbi:MAG: hypothetical protein K0R80_1016 [Clostridia bacterium]|jgi:hypothetical protein|nr:hypothetical protein [Clostridia bacterium]